jgi:hypothetical protein
MPMTELEDDLLPPDDEPATLAVKRLWQALNHVERSDEDDIRPHFLASVQWLLADCNEGVGDGVRGLGNLSTRTLAIIRAALIVDHSRIVTARRLRGLAHHLCGDGELWHGELRLVSAAQPSAQLGE